MITDDRRPFCDPRSSTIIWKPGFNLGDDVTESVATTREWISIFIFIYRNGERYLSSRDFTYYSIHRENNVANNDNFA